MKLSIYMLFMNIIAINTIIYHDDTKGNHPIPKGFGQYYVVLRYLAECDPDIPENPANENQYNFIINHPESKDIVINGYLNIAFNIPLNKFKFMMVKETESKKEEPYMKSIISPCTHQIIKSLMEFTNDCKMKKNNYTFSNFSPQKLLYKMFGNRSDYGRRHVTAEAYTPEAKIMCLNIIADVKRL